MADPIDSNKLEPFIPDWAELARQTSQTWRADLLERTIEDVRRLQANAYALGRTHGYAKGKRYRAGQPDEGALEGVIDTDPGLLRMVADAIAEVGGVRVSDLNAYRVILALRDSGAAVVYASAVPPEAAPVAEPLQITETPVSAQKVIAFCDHQLETLRTLDSVRNELEAMKRAAQTTIARHQRHRDP